MTWDLSSRIDLRNDRVANSDADRQTRTASEILRRLDGQPGVILADEVGMGKTYVALAVAVSVIEATRRKHPVVVMVPSSVAEKWPTEWAVFADRCLAPGHGLRASEPVRTGSDFLKLLDDPADRRRHLVFVTHGALSGNLKDPFIRLALLRQATQRRSELLRRRRAIARSAVELLGDKRFQDEALVELLLATPEKRWWALWNEHQPQLPLDDDPVPFALLDAVRNVDLDPLRQAVFDVPVRHGASYQTRVRHARRQLTDALNTTWKSGLRALNQRLPLLILDEAHHVKNPNGLARLFANEEAEADAEALQGPLGNMFAKMLFLTATPFQLGHHELLHVLKRFHGVRWPTQIGRARFDADMDQLRQSLDRAQGSALRLERAWSRIELGHASVVSDLSTFAAADDQPESLRTALTIGADAQDRLTDANDLLRPWVIRHTRPDRASRRHYQPGRSIADGDPERGLPVDGDATLPFLLASRAQALASLHGSDAQGATRSYFAYGLASSFEAYRDTRNNRTARLDDLPEEQVAVLGEAPQLSWYLDRIAAAIPADAPEQCAGHPKITATVERVRRLWCQGEKCLVFCFYVETGRALRSHISRALNHEILSRAAPGLDREPTDETGILTDLRQLGDRLLRSDTTAYRNFRSHLRTLTPALDEPTADELADVVVRFMRTPSFLARFVEPSQRTTIDDLVRSLEQPGADGTTVAERITAFADTLAGRVDHERREMLDALNRIQTGDITAIADDTTDQPGTPTDRQRLLPNVRLANGSVPHDTRRRLMLAFNTPFFPEILVASAVMAEGVDLHGDCRHVIHHDLDWNPAVLEQRTGRLDRIGSKGERVRQPVVVYEPYLAGTHDEKLFRVVKDRARWFGVVMGNTPGADERATEEEAERVPLPRALARQLTMDLALATER
jgi:hypothetical protein